MLLELFFNEPSKHWLFKELRAKAKISEPQLTKWLHRFTKEGLIKRIKPHSKMPYYVGNYESGVYKNRKRLFAYNRLYETGFLNYLLSLKKAETVIIFGSFSRWDWYSKSDIDLFIYGSTDGLNLGAYEKKLHRDIEVFSCKNTKQLNKFGVALIRNIIKGNIVKGDIKFLEVMPHASIQN